MRLHSLQHVPFEGFANIEHWAKAKNHPITKTLLFKGDPLPSFDHFDWLIVMGGPMNADEDAQYPWLAREKKFLEKAIAKGKTVLGICLGAQLIARALGARVFKNEQKEIGWHPVRLTEEGKQSGIFNVLPPEFTAFHWHGDTFDLPRGAKHMAESDACRGQAFQYGSRVIGLQFHIESSEESIRNLILRCAGELRPGTYIQAQNHITGRLHEVGNMQKMLIRFLDRLERETVV